MASLSNTVISHMGKLPNETKCRCVVVLCGVCPPVFGFRRQGSAEEGSNERTKVRKEQFLRLASTPPGAQAAIIGANAFHFFFSVAQAAEVGI